VLDSSVASIRDQLRFERSTLATLLDREFDSPDALFEALEMAGYQHAPDRLRGELLGYSGDRGYRQIRPHGLRRFVRPYGWAVDLDAPGEPVFVAFVWRQRILGVGLTRERAGDGAPELEGVGGDTPNVLFRSLIAKPTPRVRREDDLWVVAISPAGRFARLPYAHGALDRMQ
jgi:hypothetical protein